MNEMIHCFACGHKIHNSAANCPSCGAVQANRPVVNQNSELQKKAWNWSAAIFQGAYYAGKGRFWKGLIYGIFGIFPLIAIVNFFRLGTKANDELETKSFKWMPAIFVGLINYLGYLILLSLNK